jgi:GNAT superfamily N-acetyltransferase
MVLVYDAWANSFRKSLWAGCVPNNLWDSVSRAMITDIIDRGAKVIVAVTPIEGGEGRRVMGYTVSEPDRRTLHWLYTKRDYRGLGVGKALLAETCPEGEWTYTCRTGASAGFLGARFHWNPVSARVK